MFYGCLLCCFQVRVSKVQVETTSYHSVELQGPVLPHAVLGLCDLLKPTSEQFSLTFANLESTKAFSEAMHAPGTCSRLKLLFTSCLFHYWLLIALLLYFTAAAGSPNDKENLTTNSSTSVPCVFGQENLSDCGLSKNSLEQFCSSDTNQVQLMESLKFSDGIYTWV